MAAHAHEPSSSSSSCTSETDCDVFLSFSGKDTYGNLTGHLRVALDRAGIVSFVANTDLEGGDTLWPALEKAITRSRIFIPIFSKNYSSSKWCLDELVKSRETKDQIVLPIFFDVNPCDVRTQGGDFGQQFQQLAKRSDKVTVERWKKALEEAGYCRGYDLRNGFNGNQPVLVETVVQYVSDKLEETSSGVPENLVGINSVVEKLLELLNLASKGVEMVAIWGMGGIGKTTAAQAVFDQIRHQFKGCIFLEDIREASKQFNGLVGLQRDLLRGILNQEFKFLGSATYRKSLIRNRLKAKKVLIVLDDVDEVDQLDALAGNVNWFGKGSRIIVTTRDMSVLKGRQVHGIYEVKELDYVQSLKLFCMHAFKNNLNPPDFMDLAERVAHSGGGLPLVLKVLGSFLSFETNRKEWEYTLCSLINIPLDEVRSRLRISYDGLPFWYKEIFLDISCFFTPINMEDAASILHSHDYSVTSVIKGLVQRSLVKIDSFNRLRMHDQLRDMGRDVVYKESPNEPGKRSRLWLQKDVLNVLKEHEGTKSVKGLVLKFKDETALAGMQFKTKAFAPMSELRLLQIDYVRLVGNFKKKLFSNLRWLSWKGCPLESIPSNFDLKKLIVLDLSYSRIEQVSKGRHKKGIFHELKVLKLSGCQHLTKTPKFSRLPNLEELNLKGCIGLRKISNSICNLKFIKKLIFSGCSNVNELSYLRGSLQGLELLKLDGCKLLSGSLDWIGYMKNLKEITLDGTSITELADAVGLLENIEVVSLNHCSKLVKLPNSMGRMRLLKRFYIDGTSIVKFPEDFGMLSRLKVLSMNNCREFRGFPDNFGNLCSLSQLYANGCNFCSLPAISALPLLWCFHLNNCRNLQYLREIPSSLEVVRLNNCISLEKISALSGLKTVLWLELSNCKKLAEIQGIENMKEIRLLWMNGCSRTLVNCVNNGLSPGCLQRLKFWSFPGNQIPDFFTPLKPRYAPGAFADMIILDFEEVHTGLWNSEQHQKIAGLLLCLVLKNTAVRLPFDLHVCVESNGRPLSMDHRITHFIPPKRHEDQIFFYRFDGEGLIPTLEEWNGTSFKIAPSPHVDKDDMDSVWEEREYRGRVIEVKKAAMYVLYGEMEQSIFNRIQDFITHWSHDDVVVGGEPGNRKRKFLQLRDQDDGDGVPSNSKKKISPIA